MLFINIILVTIITVYIIDISDIMTWIKTRLKRWLDIKSEISIKPFDCSLCMSHWINLCLYLLMAPLTLTSFLEYYTFILFMSTNAYNIATLIHLINDSISKLLEKIYTFFNI